ncbi:hypothetical protein [Paraburkholderia ferrariae]|uniref:hypothetical protein n=1 Tax=Paraburkholderia ferrariae TaxID=386056 RepID=UPI0012EC290D|nr:hypothetical protein [Paraburkholderia ferrariae]
MSVQRPDDLQRAAAEVRRLKQLEQEKKQENARVEKMLAERDPELDVMKERDEVVAFGGSASRTGRSLQPVRWVARRDGECLRLT